jgi:hypothetical protein
VEGDEPDTGRVSRDKCVADMLQVRRPWACHRPQSGHVDVVVHCTTYSSHLITRLFEAQP